MSRYINVDELIFRLKNDPLFSFVEDFGITKFIESQPIIDGVDKWLFVNEKGEAKLFRYVGNGVEVTPCTPLEDNSIFWKAGTPLKVIETGRWLQDERWGTTCSVCGFGMFELTPNPFESGNKTPYCPNCGATMVNKDE